jgi:hypothetical protein
LSGFIGPIPSRFWTPLQGGLAELNARIAELQETARAEDEARKRQYLRWKPPPAQP